MKWRLHYIKLCDKGIEHHTWHLCGCASVVFHFYSLSSLFNYWNFTHTSLDFIIIISVPIKVTWCVLICVFLFIIIFFKCTAILGFLVPAQTFNPMFNCISFITYRWWRWGVELPCVWITKRIFHDLVSGHCVLSCVCSSYWFTDLFVWKKDGLPSGVYHTVLGAISFTTVTLSTLKSPVCRIVHRSVYNASHKQSVFSPIHQCFWKILIFIHVYFY